MKFAPDLTHHMWDYIVMLNKLNLMSDRCYRSMGLYGVVEISVVEWMRDNI